MAAIEELLRDVVLTIIRTYRELPLEQVIEHAWRNQDIEQHYDFPEAEVKNALEALEQAGTVKWNRQSDIVTYVDTQSPDYSALLRQADNVTKWEIVLVGNYSRASGESIDMTQVWNSVKSTPLRLLFKSDRDDENPASNFSVRRKEINIIWAFEAVRCSCLWAPDRFVISSFMFRDPSREIVDYALAQLDPMPELVIKAIPFAGAYILYSYMKQIVTSLYADVVFKLTRIGESRVKEGSFD